MSVGSSSLSIPVTTLLPWRNLKRKKVIIIISITQKEAFYLNKEKNVPYGEGGISVTHSRHSGKSYNLCRIHRETLEKYRKSRIIEK